MSQLFTGCKVLHDPSRLVLQCGPQVRPSSRLSSDRNEMQLLQSQHQRQQPARHVVPQLRLHPLLSVQRQPEFVHAGAAADAEAAVGMRTRLRGGALQRRRMFGVRERYWRCIMLFAV
jgi:hypothetical protein